MVFNFDDFGTDLINSIAREYEENGFFILSGLEELSQSFKPLLRKAVGTAAPQLEGLLSGSSSVLFPEEVRSNLARLTTTDELSQDLLKTLGPLFLRLLGPLVHVSSTFHAQVKTMGGVTVDHGGYPEGTKFMEVHGPYLLHQDFAGANLPTSPSAMTLWMPLNSSPDWNLRIYPGSHKRGLLCNKWLNLDDNRLNSLGDPLDLAAKEGHAIFFNAMLHGTSNPGPAPRVSCDIRFFPLCGFLPTTVHLLSQAPQDDIRKRLEQDRGPTLRTPILEYQAFLGENEEVKAEPHSVLNWPNYISETMQGNMVKANEHLTRFTNEEIGSDPAPVYISKFQRHPVHTSTIDSARTLAAATEVRADR